MKLRYHFARQRRQLIHLGKRLSRLRQAGQMIPRRELDRFQRLFHQLAPRLGRAGLRHALGGAALLLGLSGSMAAQGGFFDYPQGTVETFGLDTGGRISGNVYNEPVLADLDNDGDLDLLTQFYADDDQGTDIGWLYFENTGTDAVPSFAEGIENPFGLTYVAEAISSELTDLDGDGDLDLLTSGSNFAIGSEVDFLLLYRENTGTAAAPAFASPIDFSPVLGDATESNIVEFVTGDFDGDGDIDLLGSIFDEYTNDLEDEQTIVFLENRTLPGAPQPNIVLRTGFAGLSLQALDVVTGVSDLDDDGDLDLLGVEVSALVEDDSEPRLTSNAFYLLNTGDATNADFSGDRIAIDNTEFTGYYTSIPTFGDLDNDGDLELLLSSYEEGLLYFTNDAPSGVRDENLVEIDLSLAPNPTDGIVRISTTETLTQLDVMDAIGRTVATQTGSFQRLDLAKFPTGVYTIRFTKTDGTYGLRRVVKQ